MAVPPVTPTDTAPGLELLASAGHAWVAVSGSGTIVGWNRWAERVFGWPQEEVVGRPLSLLLTRDGDATEQALEEAAREPRLLVGRTMSLPARHRDGHEIDAEFTVALRDEDGVPTFHAFVRDVSEAKRFERFVAAQRAVSEALLSRVPADGLLREVMAALARSLQVDVGVLWTSSGPAPALEPERVVGPPASRAADLALLQAAAPDPVAAACETRCATFRHLDGGGGGSHSGVWIPVFAGEDVAAVIELLVNRRVPEVQGIALDILTAMGAHVGYALHQRQAEARLVAVSEQNQRILEATSDGVLGVDRDGRARFVNPSAARTLGLSEDEIIGRDLHSLLHTGADHGADECTLLAAVRGSTSLPLSDARYYAHGRALLVECACAPLGPPGTGAVLTFRDVTERRELEAARSRDLGFLQTLLDSMEEGVVACAADGTLTLFNRALQGFLGKPALPLGPQNWTETYNILDPSTLRPMPAAELPLSRALDGEVVSGAPVMIERTDGALRRLSVNARPLVNADGDRLGAVGTVRDITEQYEALQRMEEAERLAAVGIWEIDLDTREVFWSPGIYRILGLEPGSVEPSEDIWRERMHPDDRDVSYGRMERAVAAGQDGWHDRYRVVREDGQVRQVQSFGEMVRNSAGQIKRLRGSVQDYTERAEAEAALRRTEARARMTDRMESLGQLAGGVAHDFNNLLAVMISYSEFALEDLPADSPVRADVAEIRRAAERAADLTQRLLVFSRGEAVRAELVDLGKLVTELEPMLHRTLGENLEIVIETDDSLEPVSADGAQLEQMLLNLAINARDAMPDGGVLRITLGREEIEESGDDQLAPGSYARIDVTDTGVGMPPEVAAHVFEPFFTTKAKGRGTGLGLATAYGVVNEAGGAINVRSAPGAGSTFSVHLPMVDEEPAHERQGRSTPPEPARALTARVLVVEDDAMVRTATSRILARAGYSVTEAGNGAEALAALGDLDGAVDLLVTDVVMPGLSGWDLHTRVSERWPHIPTLFMSGHTDDHVGRDALTGPGIEFIRKPFEASALLAVVGEHIAR